MNLDERHCSAPPPYLLMALAAVAALALLCLLCFFCRRKTDDKTENKDQYVPLKTQVAPAGSAARITHITANEHPTPAKRPAAAPASVRAVAAAADEATQTWTLKGMEHPKGQSKKFVDEDALAGQIGCTSTWRLTPGVPLTFHTPNGEVETVFALKKPLMLGYLSNVLPIKINEKLEGHGTELGIDLGWTLTGIGYKDITEMPFAEADKLLHEKVGELPGAIPLTFKRNNGQVQTTYAYQKPLGLTFLSQLPIKITAEEEGHHAQHIGIKIGWELQAVNYIKIKDMTDFEEVAAILRREVAALPSE